MSDVWQCVAVFSGSDVHICEILSSAFQPLLKTREAITVQCSIPCPRLDLIHQCILEVRRLRAALQYAAASHTLHTCALSQAANFCTATWQGSPFRLSPFLMGNDELFQFLKEACNATRGGVSEVAVRSCQFLRLSVPQWAGLSCF